jgi:hypothetical protein
VLERIVVCLFRVELLAFRDPVVAGLRITGVLTDRRVLDEPLEILEDVRGLEIVRLGVLLLELRLDVIDLERLGEELRVDVLGDDLRVELRLGLDALGALDRVELLDLDELGRAVLEVRDCGLEAAALRLLLLLLELLLFRELLDAQTGSAANANIRMQKVNNKKVIPACRDSTILIVDL